MSLLLLFNLSRHGEYRTALPPSKKACSQSSLKIQVANLPDLTHAEKAGIICSQCSPGRMGMSEHYGVTTI